MTKPKTRTKAIYKAKWEREHLNHQGNGPYHILGQDFQTPHSSQQIEISHAKQAEYKLN